MRDTYTHMITVFLGFFAIMNPIANAAAFMGLVGDKNKSERFHIAIKALIITFFLILLFSLLGKLMFHFFGITLTALRIAGGILVFLVGYHMLGGGGSKLNSADAGEDSDVAISPLAVPLLAGPGTIATAMHYSASGGIMGITVTVTAFAVLCLITFFCFIFGSNILAVIGQSGLGIVTRLMGLILSVIGTQMVIAGTTAVLDSLSQG
ncbi:MAG: MarC family protein [Deltaproteobacteria bacterium]|nr:MarC family protein [Deltaproteobacteria bacterium]